VKANTAVVKETMTNGAVAYSQLEFAVQIVDAVLLAGHVQVTVLSVLKILTAFLQKSDTPPK
jgi:formylmethanofuran dehydrogenase subunit E-like metal-binding protein